MKRGKKSAGQLELPAVQVNDEGLKRLLVKLPNLQNGPDAEVQMVLAFVLELAICSLT